MTGLDDLHALWAELQLTTKGYTQLRQPLPPGHWSNAKVIYDRLAAELASAPPRPLFGTALPARLPEANGSIVSVSTLAELQSALPAVAAGTRIQAHGVTYGAGDPTQFSFATRGTRAEPVQLEAYPGEKPVLAKLFKVTGGAFRIRGFQVSKNSYPTDARLGKAAVPGGGNVGFWVACPDAEIDRCDIYGSTMSGLFVDGDRVQLWNTRVRNCGTSHDDHGVYWAGGAGGLAANMILDHNACFGFQVQYASSGIVLANSTLVYNGVSFAGSGTVQDAPAHDIVYANVVSAFNGEVGFKSYTATSKLIRSLAYGNPQGATYGPFGSVDLLPAADPLLDAAFKPANGSPCIDAGDPAYTPPFDFYGRPRVAADLGAVAA